MRLPSYTGQHRPALQHDTNFMVVPVAEVAGFELVARWNP